MFAPYQFIAFLFAIVLCGCDFNIENGDFNSLKIGMSKTGVVNALLTEHVNYIEPRVDENILITSDTLGELDRLKNTEGICITDNGSFGLHIVFDNSGMSHSIYKTFNVDLSALGLEYPLSRKDTFEKIKSLVHSKQHITAFNCILDVKNMPLNDINFSDLERINTWLYHIPKTHSAVTLKFIQDKLVKIIYHWQPFEMP